MTNPDIPRFELQPRHAEEAVAVAAGKLMLATEGDVLDPKIISPGPPSYVAAYPNAENPEYAVRVVHGAEADAADLLADAQLEVETIRALRENGAQVLRYVRDAMPVKLSHVPGVFVATATEFLPGKSTYGGHGQAMASMHNASPEIDLSRVREINPLAQVEKYIPYLLDCDAAGKPFTIGNTVITKDDLNALISHLVCGRETLAELYKVTREDGQPLVIVQEDVHNENVAQDKYGVDTLMDVQPLKGPAALDYAGRARTDWAPRFGAPLQDLIDFDEGYLSRIRPELVPSLQAQKLAKDYMNIRSSLILFWLAIGPVVANHPGEEWMLKESLHRMRTINDRNARWNPLSKAQKEAMRGPQDTSA